jgi:hypothetical protein
MKPSLKFVLLFALAFLADDGAAFGAEPIPKIDYTPPQPDASVPGRFLLIAAPVHLNGVEAPPVPVLFRIDTATGQIWRFMSVPYPVNDPKGQIKTVTVEGWSMVAEDLQSSLASGKATAEFFQNRR